MQEDKKVIKLSDDEIAKGAAAQADREKRLGKGDDGDFLILEMDQRTGAQTLISAPNLNLPIKDVSGAQQVDEAGEPLYQWQALSFSNRALAEAWVEERGEQGFSYMILKGVSAQQGARTAPELEALVAQDAEALKEAITEDQTMRKE